MLRYQQAHLAVQPENSAPWTWPLLLHPVRYFEACAAVRRASVVALGNPALWWGFLLLLPVAIVQIVRRATWQDAVVFGGYAAMFLPWFLIGRTQFIWYMLPAVPFMCLAVAATLRRLPPRIARNAAHRVRGSDRRRRRAVPPGVDGVGRAELVDPRAGMAPRLADVTPAPDAKEGRSEDRPF